MSNEEKITELVNRGNDAAVDELWDDAIEHFGAALELQPNSAAVLAKRAHCRVQRGDFWLALADARVAMATDPTHAQAAERCGDALAALGEWEMALAAFERCAALHAKSATVRRVERKRANAATKLSETPLVLPAWLDDIDLNNNKTA